MNFPAIRIEGGILSPDLLERLESQVGQKPQDFGLAPERRLKDEIAQTWAEAQNLRASFRRRLETLKAKDDSTQLTQQNWLLPFLGLLGYQLQPLPNGLESNQRRFELTHLASNCGDAPLQLVGYRDRAGLDRKPEGARMSAHGQVQHFLNLNDQLYGLVSNGRLLRLLRDSSRLIKLSYLEFDLDLIFENGLFADFACLFRLLHASRLPTSQETAASSLIESYHQESLESGARIREGLSAAVRDAILSFGQGLIDHPNNQTLRHNINNNNLSAQNYYRHLLRLIYRLLFLMVIEERDLVYPKGENRKERDLYRNYYSLLRLRLLCEKRHLHDPKQHDLWLQLLATFSLFEVGGPGHRLGLMPLAGDLFHPTAIDSIKDASLDNRCLLRCLEALSLYELPTKTRVRINYGALNVEEFGSVYEGLLELEPFFECDGALPRFDFRAGKERAASGSHYTPDDLVQPLIQHSLDYLITEKRAQPKPAEALLQLRVVDISCGSGHILLAAARRIATELAAVRSGEEQPSPENYRKALRDVIRTCIYGVDLNMLAVELCKVALWLEAHIPGQPLNFLDHHIKWGNAIVGFANQEELERGVPDEAFSNMPGDDKQVGVYFRKRNKQERKEFELRQRSIYEWIKSQLQETHNSWKRLAALPEETPQQIEDKKQAFLAYGDSPDYMRLWKLASIPIAQFYLAKTERNQSELITDREFRAYWNQGQPALGRGVSTVGSLAREKRFFHWFLEFPEIIANGGFDCILGNPPYLGGQALSGTYGYPFCHFVRWEYAPSGLSDLVLFFVRRIFGLLKPQGLMAFITTNSIKDGDVRKDGLEQVVAQGGGINMAVRGVKWPGRANLVVSLLAINKGREKVEAFLDGKMVKQINAFLEEGIAQAEPQKLETNAEQIFQGSIFLGDGFLLTHEKADELLALDPKNSDVIFPLINGQEVNNIFNQKPQRMIINFHDWPESQAMKYDLPFEIIKSFVKPERLKNKRISHLPWWLYERTRIELYKLISKNLRCFVAARITKYLNFSSAPNDFVYTDTIYVFATDRWDLYSVVQSSLHEAWARRYSSLLGQTLRYSPTDCFETFAFPEGIWEHSFPLLAELGERYHEFRRELMLRLWLGLTELYNLFHHPELSPELVAKKSKKPEAAERGYQELLQLRQLHRQLDEAVRDAYGWQDLPLEHGFHEYNCLAENDRVRFGLSPNARQQILARLLQRNHKCASEQTATKPQKRTAKAPRKTPEPPPDQLGLFGNS